MTECGLSVDVEQWKITYPHSDSKHLEKRLSAKITHFFVKIFCGCGGMYDTSSR
jgi:hypothetical protein